MVLAGVQWSSCLVYLDDVIIVGKTFKDHLQNLREVFNRLRAAGLKLKLICAARKCNSLATLCQPMVYAQILRRRTK